MQLGDHTDILFNRGVLDLHMMVSLNGAERTEPQWMAMMLSAGFHVEKIAQTRCHFSIVKAVPIEPKYGS